MNKLIRSSDWFWCFVKMPFHAFSWFLMICACLFWRFFKKVIKKVIKKHVNQKTLWHQKNTSQWSKLYFNIWNPKENDMEIHLLILPDSQNEYLLGLFMNCLHVSKKLKHGFLNVLFHLFKTALHKNDFISAAKTDLIFNS